ncbi:MAG: hypothetical protein ACI814_003899, partial [Mariniblastus sp.]
GREYERNRQNSLYEDGMCGMIRDDKPPDSRWLSPNPVRQIVDSGKSTDKCR